MMRCSSRGMMSAMNSRRMRPACRFVLTVRPEVVGHDLGAGHRLQRPRWGRSLPGRIDPRTSHASAPGRGTARRWRRSRASGPPPRAGCACRCCASPPPASAPRPGRGTGGPSPSDRPRPRHRGARLPAAPAAIDADLRYQPSGSAPGNGPGAPAGRPRSGSPRAASRRDRPTPAARTSMRPSRLQDSPRDTPRPRPSRRANTWTGSPAVIVHVAEGDWVRRWGDATNTRAGATHRPELPAPDSRLGLFTRIPVSANAFARATSASSACS